MCSSHIIDELALALLASVSIATVFRDGMAYLLANDDARTRRGTAGQP